MLTIPRASPPRRLTRAVFGAGLLLCGAAPAHAVLATVTTTADTGAGSLRAAIAATNAASGGTIKFAIPLALGIDIDNGLPGGDAQADVFRIRPRSPLPSLTAATIVDGDSQAAFAGDTNPNGPEIAIQGSASGAGLHGLDIRAASCRITGLLLNGWAGAAVLIGDGTIGVSGVRVTGNYLGTNYRGTAPVGNGTGVFLLNGSTNNIIGGTTSDARNVISGNIHRGVWISGTGTTGNKVQGNYIGTDATGSRAVGNTLAGVFIDNNATNNTVGGPHGPDSLVRNIISGNGEDGVLIATPGNKVQGNFIGTDVTGTKAVGNGASGVTVDGGSNNFVGGSLDSGRNIISGNVANGVELRNGANGNFVQGNYIGTRASGLRALPNTNDGVLISASNGNAVGGNAVGERNIISGNKMAGIDIKAGATGNTVAGNYIGTDKSGALPLGNQNEGVFIFNAPGNTVGGTATGARNVISSNSLYGVNISGLTATGNAVQGNYIGTDKLGTSDLGNVGEGVLIASAPDNLVGGTTAAARNIISGNGLYGVRIVGVSAMGNKLQGNYIGTDAGGSADLGNTMDGVNIRAGASNNIVGGAVARAGNRIAFNTCGVRIEAGTGNTIRRNSIFSNDGLGIDLDPSGVTPNDIGPPHDTDTGANNLQNSPQFNSATTDGSALTVFGRLRSAANTTFVVEFFSNAGCDATGSGEGKIFIASKLITTDSDGEAFYTFTFSDAIPAGNVITATATDPDGNTSEFSVCESVIADSTTIATAGQPRNHLG